MPMILNNFSIIVANYVLNDIYVIILYVCYHYVLTRDL